MTYRGRFAPSPTGALHLGSLVAAFGSWLAARQAGGEWLVRIEDVDPPREVAGAADAQLRTLSALGLHADGPVLRQSTRSLEYQQALQRLLDQGDAFVCHCSRSDLVASHGIHRACRPGARRVDTAIRLRVDAGTTIDVVDAIQGPHRQEVAREVGDFVLRRADGYWAYQLAVVVDDAAQGITDIVRGADLLDSTARQILLQQRLGLPTPRYAHLPQIVDGDGQKLSKSLSAQAIDEAAPAVSLRRAWALLGQSTTLPDGISHLDDLLARAVSGFALDRVPKGPVQLFAATHNDAVKQRV